MPEQWNQRQPRMKFTKILPWLIKMSIYGYRKRKLEGLVLKILTVVISGLRDHGWFFYILPLVCQYLKSVSATKRYPLYIRNKRKTNILFKAAGKWRSDLGRDWLRANLPGTSNIKPESKAPKEGLKSCFFVIPSQTCPEAHASVIKKKQAHYFPWHSSSW